MSDPLAAVALPDLDGPLEPTPAPPPPEASHRKALLSGGFWQVLPQVTSLVVNLALTPYLLHGLGVARYGVFMFAFTVSALLGAFDGGLTGSALRHFSIFAGRDDKVETTRLVVTLVGVVSVAAVAVVGVAWAGAGAVAGHLHMDASLVPESTFLLKITGVYIALCLLRNIPGVVLLAHQRYMLPGVMLVVLYGEYAAGLVLTVQNGWGLRGVAWTLLVQQLLVTVVILPATFRHLTWSGLRFYRWAELKEFLGYAGKVQVVGLANLFLQEMDVLLIGAVLPIRYVAIYNAGANMALQLRSAVLNARGPIMTSLGQTLGREGRAAMDRRYARIQRVWVQAVAGWCLVGGAAVGFGIVAWLGHDFTLGGVVAAIALAGNLFYLGPTVLLNALGLLGRPGLEARYAVVMVVVNVVLTVPLLLTGPVGVAAATAVAQLAAAVYLVRVVRRSVAADLAGFLRDVPWTRALVATAVTAALELAVHPVSPQGPVGLLLAGVPAAVGLLLYAVLVLGPERTRSLAGQGISRVRTRIAS